MPPEILPSSFRDPSGFVFKKDGEVFRQVNSSYSENYSRLIDSGLYSRLVEKGLLLSHEEVDSLFVAPGGFKVLRPRRVPFISYPFEWSFTQLKNAALTTLEIQRESMKSGLSLKDASAYNIQFVEGRPILMDTLSFEVFDPGKPWVAYRQFCQHFLAPLLLMRYKDVRCGLLSRIFLDGIPLDMTSGMLPKRTYFRFSIFAHIHLHAYFQGKKTGGSVKPRKLPDNAIPGLVDGLFRAVKNLQLPALKSTWSDYYHNTNYSEAAFQHKTSVVGEWIRAVKPAQVWDLGANTGAFSRLAAQEKIPVMAFDFDARAVDIHYQELMTKGEKNILPLVMNLENPSPGLGWAGRERMSLGERGPADMIMALALIHHLAIGNNLPFRMIAGYLAECCHTLIIEFIEKEDSQVVRMLVHRQDVFQGYNRASFEEEFGNFFEISETTAIQESQRVLYLMRSKRHSAQP